MTGSHINTAKGNKKILKIICTIFFSVSKNKYNKNIRKMNNSFLPRISISATGWRTKIGENIARRKKRLFKISFKNL